MQKLEAKLEAQGFHLITQLCNYNTSRQQEMGITTTDFLSSYNLIRNLLVVQLNYTWSQTSMRLTQFGTVTNVPEKDVKIL